MKCVCPVCEVREPRTPGKKRCPFRLRALKRISAPRLASEDDRVMTAEEVGRFVILTLYVTRVFGCWKT